MYGNELLSLLILLTKNVFPSRFKSSPWKVAEMVLVPFPDHETVFQSYLNLVH